MNKQLATILETAIIPRIIEIIVEKEGIDEIEAITKFYKSETYEILLDEETDIWHFSPLTIYNMFNDEITKGKIDFPVEG